MQRDLSNELVDVIKNTLNLIEEHSLSEVSFLSNDVKWFSSVSERIYQEIKSNLHVDKDCVYFSGTFDS